MGRIMRQPGQACLCPSPVQERPARRDQGGRAADAVSVLYCGGEVAPPLEPEPPVEFVEPERLPVDEDEPDPLVEPPFFLCREVVEL